MAFLSFGTAAGLAYQHDYNADIARMHNNELADAQARISAENKAALLGDRLKAKHLSTRWDNQEAAKFVEGRVTELASFVSQNPDYATHPLLQAKYQELMDGIDDNEYVHNSMNATTNYNLLTKYIADNPGSESDPQIQAQLEAFDNYNKTGSIDGVSGNRKMYIFSAPDKFDPVASVGAVYGKLKAHDALVSGNGLGKGAVQSKVSKEVMMATAASLLSGPESYKYQRVWDQKSEGEKSFYGNDPVTWIAGIGEGFTENSLKTGTYFAPQRVSGGGSGSGSGGRGAPAWSAWQHDYYRLQQSNTPQYLPNVSKMIPMVDGKIQVEGDLKVPVTDANGAVSYVTIPGYAGQLVDAKVIGRTQIMDGVPYTQVQVKVPMNDAMVKGSTPLFEDLSWGLGSWEGDGSDDVKEIDAYKPVASFARGEDGKLLTDENDTPYALITTYVRVPTDPVNQRNYDKMETETAMSNKGEDIRQDNFTMNQAAAIGESMGLDVSQMQLSPSTGQYYAPDARGVLQLIPLQ